MPAALRSLALVVVALVAGMALGYVVAGAPLPALRTVTSTVTTTATLTKTLEVTHTTTETLTATKTVTKTVERTVTLMETVTRVVTRTLTEVVTETATETVTVTKVRLFLSTGELAGKWVPPPECKEMDRKVFDEKAVICALSQWTLLKEAAQVLRVPGDPWETAIKAARWVAEHVEYEKDEDLFKVENYVQLPLETLTNGYGDCEDQSLLLAALLLATGEFREVVVADVEYYNKTTGHVEAGFELNGKVYLVPWVNDTYPMELGTDYYGDAAVHNETIANVTLYYVVLENGEPRIAEKVFLDHSNYTFTYTYPPPITSKHLEAIKKAVEEFLESKGYRVRGCPAYLDEIAEYIARFEPQKRPPLAPVPYYYAVYLPIDWYSPKDPKWVAWRALKNLEAWWDEVKRWLARGYKGCVAVYVELDNVTVNDYVYDVHCNPVEVRRTKPVIVAYLLLPSDYPVPWASVELGDKLVVKVNTTDERAVEVLFYEYHAEGYEPVLGIVKKGWRYANIPYVEADRWDVVGGETVVEVSMDKVRRALKPGVYLLIVWAEGREAYLKVVELGG